MATIEQIRQAAKRVSAKQGEPGVFRLSPPVALICKPELAFNPTNTLFDPGEIVHARMIDAHYLYPECVSLAEKAYWWPIKDFDIAPAEQTPSS